MRKPYEAEIIIIIPIIILQEKKLSNREVKQFASKHTASNLWSQAVQL